MEEDGLFWYKITLTSWCVSWDNCRIGRWQTGRGGLMLWVTLCLETLSLTHATYLCIVADFMYPFMAAGDGLFQQVNFITIKYLYLKSFRFSTSYLKWVLQKQVESTETSPVNFQDCCCFKDLQLMSELNSTSMQFIATPCSTST